MRRLGVRRNCRCADSRQALLVAATLEVALELAGDGLAGGLGELGGVAGLLEGPDVLGDVLVLLGELVDPALPGAGVLGQVAEGDAHLEEVLDPAEQGEGGLGAGRLRDVVRHGGPVGHGGDVEPGAGVLEDADDAGRTFVRRHLELEPVDELGLGGGAGDRDRAGVRGVGQQRPEGDHDLAAQVVGRGEQLGAELPPAHVGLDAADQDDVAVQVGRAGDRDLGARPGDGAVAALVGTHQRAVDLEVVELLGVDGADDPGAPDLDEVVDDRRGRVRGVVPALERRDDDRVDQVRDVLDLDHGDHPMTPHLGADGPPRFLGAPARCHHAITPSATWTEVPRLGAPAPGPEEQPCPSTSARTPPRSSPRCSASGSW